MFRANARNYFNLKELFRETMRLNTGCSSVLSLQSTQKYPAAVRIYQYFNDGGIIEYGKLAAYSVVYMLPCIMLYAFAQKFMSQGFALSGGDKG